MSLVSCNKSSNWDFKSVTNSPLSWRILHHSYLSTHLHKNHSYYMYSEVDVLSKILSGHMSTIVWEICYFEFIKFGNSTSKS